VPRRNAIEWDGIDVAEKPHFRYLDFRKFRAVQTARFR